MKKELTPEMFTEEFGFYPGVPIKLVVNHSVANRLKKD